MLRRLCGAPSIPLIGEHVEIEIKVNKRRLTSKQIDDLLDEIVTDEFVVNAIEEFKYKVGAKND